MRFRTIDPFADFDNFWNTATRRGVRNDYDVVRHPDRLELFFDVPGVDPEAIELTVDGRDLVLEAERTLDIADDATLVQQGRAHGSISRRIHLGDSLDVNGLDAYFEHGVLRVTLPFSADAAPRKISIGSESGTA